MKVVLFALLIFSSVVAPTAAKVGPNSSEADILETVFRHQIARCYKDRIPQTYFLSYKDGDPSEALMARFRSDQPRVRIRSQMFGFKDKQTGDRGILLAIRRVDWLNDRTVAVTGTCGAAMLDAYSYVYRVVRRKGKWTVTRRKLSGVA